MPRVIGYLVIAASALTLVGWFANIQRLTDWDGKGVSMFPNAALCAALGAAGLILCTHIRHRADGLSRVVQLVGSLIATVGLLVLFQHLTMINLGIDTLIVRRDWGQSAAASPMRIGVPSSTAFTLIGVALVLLGRGTPRARWAVSMLGTVALCVASLSLVGYLYGAQRLYAIPRYTAIALQTAILIASLAVGLIALVPECGLAALVRAPHAGGVMARRMVLPLLAASIALGWFRVLGERLGLYDSAFGSACRTLIEAILLMGTVWWAAKGLARADQRREAAEARTRRSMEIFTTLVDRSPFGMYTVDADFRIAHMNRSSADGAFVHVRPLIGRDFGEALRILWPPAVAEEIEALFRHTLRTGDVYRSRDFFRRRADKSTVEGYEWELHRLTMPDGRNGVICYYYDSTKLRHAQNELLVSTRALAEAQRMAHIGSWQWDAATDVTSGSDELLRIYGFDPATDRMPNFRDQRGRCYPPDDWERINNMVRATLATGEGYELDARAIRADGTLIWVTARAEAVSDSNGNIVSLRGTIQDITERKRAEEAIRRNEAIYRRLAESNLFGVGFGNSRGEILYINDEMLRMMGRTRDDYANGRINWADCIAPEYRETMRRAAGELPRVGQSAGYEAAFLRPDGGRTPYVAAAAVVDPGEDFHVSIALDLTKIREAEAQRQQLLDAERIARAEAERALRIKDEFLATLSHELRTPLNAILGWSQILLATDPHGDAATFHEGAEVIERSARAQARLIEDLLDMSRIVSGKVLLNVQTVSLGAIIESALASVRPSADAKGIGLETVVDSEVPSISGDPARLQQVLWNLLSNAIKFTDRGGKITVGLARANASVELTVADTGQGIAPEFLPHVFERFRQQDASTTRRHGGLGIGLSIVKQIVELHGGTVSVQSAGLGQGAIFSVELPLTPARPATDDHAESGSRTPTPGARQRRGGSCDFPELTGLRVLVVDDEPDAVALAKRILVECGATVATAGSVDEALAQIAKEPPDVLLSDIGMPGRDGYDLIRAVREMDQVAHRHTPAVALTAFARDDDRQRALQAGYQAHLPKPVEPADLLMTVASIARQPAG